MKRGGVPRSLFGLCPTGLRGKPGHQALAIEPSVWAWLQTGAPGFLRAGSHLLLFRLAPHLRPLCHERPYQEHKAPDNTALRFTGTRKPLHHDKVTVPGEAFTFLSVKCKYVYM